MQHYIDLSIVIPVYNSSDILPTLVNQLEAVCATIAPLDRVEIILINDCSPDNSWPVIQELAKTRSFLRGISLRKNFGQHNATMAGLNYASGEVIIIMDDDLQHPPEALPKLLAKINEGYDVCYTHYQNRQHATWKKLGSKFNNLVATSLLEKPRDLYLSSFKAIRREIAKEIIKYEGPYAYLDGLILNVTKSITSIDINHGARYIGTGNYNLRRSMSLWLKMATNFSIIPLRIATVMGFILSITSLIMLIIVIIDKIIHPTISAGWASIMTAVLFIGGIQTL